MSRPPRIFSVRQTRVLRTTASLALLAVLAACAGHHNNLAQRQEAAQYAAHARGNYVPPGPPTDPWGPYIREASARFDVPDQWIRAVMHQESGGKLYHGGELVTSWAGAMGLMQVMPATYDGLHDRYSLGDDPFGRVSRTSAWTLRGRPENAGCRAGRNVSGSAGGGRPVPQDSHESSTG